jgi:hypothetical protein
METFPGVVGLTSGNLLLETGRVDGIARGVLGVVWRCGGRDGGSESREGSKDGELHCDFVLLFPFILFEPGIRKI